MKFSVVIPLYNKAPYVIASIESVLAQSLPDLEVIVVNDGSTDNGAELVAALKDSRVVLVQQANGGVSSARNYGISLARGDWVAFLDADDWHHPHYLATLQKVQNEYPELDTVATHYLSSACDDGVWPPPWPEVHNDFDIELITDLPLRWMISQSITTSSVAVRTSLLKKMQPCFALGESRGEDLDMWFRLAEHSTIALACTPMVAYRLAVEGSLTSNHGVGTLEPFMRRMQARALSGVMPETKRRSSLHLVAQFQVTLARQSLASGRRVEGLNWLLKGHRAIRSKRWWLTAVMVFLFPKHVVKGWELWRINRTRQVIHPTSDGLDS